MEPIWKLDRQGSGQLFWRRDSGNLSITSSSSSSNNNNNNNASSNSCIASSRPKTRVKFRCDVEVLEFLPLEGEHSSEEEEDDNDEADLKEWRTRRRTKAAVTSSPLMVAFVCIAAVVVTVALPWLLVR